MGTSTSAGCAGGVVVTTLLVVAVGISGASSAEEGGAGRSGCTWSERFRQDALTGEVAAFAEWDDGSGPAVYIGGTFDRVGELTLNRVARLDGSDLSPLTGPGGTGLSGGVNALAVFDDGSGPAPYAGGFFTSAGRTAAGRVARWDGASWAPLAGPGGTGVNGSVKALEVWDDGGGPALYVGGNFATAGGETANNIARWDGSDWSSLAAPGGVGVNAEVNALAAYGDGSGPALYAGGAFGTAGGVSVSRLARWDGAAWSGLRGPAGTGVEGPVFALHAWDDGLGPALYVGGDFDTAGGLPSRHIASWRCAQGALIFTDAFETGDATAWSFTVP